MPPAAPADYKVCEGWNMVGFLGTANMTPNAYFWNWTPRLWSTDGTGLLECPELEPDWCDRQSDTRSGLLDGIPGGWSHLRSVRFKVFV